QELYFVLLFSSRSFFFILYIPLFFLLVSYLSVALTDRVNVRLVGGHSHCAGRVEVLHRDQWGTVCDDGWDMTEAAVVCRELDCGEPVDALSDAHFGSGSGPIWINYVQCTGSESTLKNCASGGWGKYGCHRSKNAGVICSGVRLVGGSRCSGRLEILHNQTWMSVCDAAFDQQDAEVVCRELDCGAPVQVLGAAAFDKGDTQMWTQEIQCRGDESQIHLCPTSHENNCSYDIDVGLVCADHVNVRLVGGHSRCAGRVEVLHRGQWGTVCHDFWDLADAAVVCRELDCGEPVDALGDAHFGSGSGPVLMSFVLCTGSESTLKMCGSEGWGKQDCDHSKDAGVICSDHVNVRLVGGHSRCAGRVEALHRGQWGTVCDDGWDMADAAVVCRELDCGEPVDALSDAHFGPGSGLIWLSFVLCSGSESTLKNCGSQGWGKHDCDHSEDAGVICSVRLVGGSRCSGRLEILHNQTWMSVCDAVFDQQDAEVVCRELDCGAPVQVLGAAAFDKGDAQMWTQEIQCRGNESQIHLCQTSPSHENNCSHDNDIGLSSLKCSIFSLLFCVFLHLKFSFSLSIYFFFILFVDYTDRVNVRLVGGHRHCAGRVEVLHRGQWGTVCDDGWDMTEAAVVCRELDCGEPVDAVGAARFGSGSGPIWMTTVLCTGSESKLKDCGSYGWGKSRCDHSKDAGVICSANSLNSSEMLPIFIFLCSDVRLVGGSRCSGRLEILHNQMWKSVCDAAFDQQDAEVVCRELDCGAPVQVLGADAFGKGDTQMWTQEIQCRGNESFILLCPTSHDIQCSQENNAALICSGKMSMLVGGNSPCSGRVEVHHDGQWGTVCHDYWDLTDVEVVCREVGCGEALNAVYRAYFGQGSGPIWMDGVVCSGSESTLKDCRSRGWETINYGRFTRLADGPHLCSGRLEILHGNTWYTVCDAAFDQQDAEVVCRELDCGAPVQVLGAAAFGKGDAQMWTQEIQCRGNEKLIRRCQSSTSNNINCAHYNHVELMCSGIFKKKILLLNRLKLYRKTVQQKSGSQVENRWNLIQHRESCTKS
uniref:SRCR domain-containing protein n=1 Tax=Cyprinus carpio TaxID=7962 RepID=A0A8C1JRE3_CYPCA